MTNRNFDIQPVEHGTEIHENGALVATLFKTFHPTIPFEVFMKNGSGKAKQVFHNLRSNRIYFGKFKRA